MSLAEAQARYAKGLNDDPIIARWGFHVSFPKTDRVQVTLATVEKHHRGGLGSDAVNGGVLSALCDLVTGCTSALVDPTRRSATAELSIHFLQPTLGDSVRAEGRLLRAGDTLLYAEVTIWGGRSPEPSVRCTGMVRMSDKPWTQTHGA